MFAFMNQLSCLSYNEPKRPCQLRNSVCFFSIGRVLLRFAAMRLFCLLSLFASLATDAWAAQFYFEFSKDSPGQMPPGFVSLVTGQGKPADWRVEEEAVAPLLAPLSDKVHGPVTVHHVLAPQSLDAQADRYPVLLFTNETFTDFTLTTRFRISGGTAAQLA